MIISICNHKGGVGKTMCTVNLAHALAIKGVKVLVIDQDSQCNCSTILEPQINNYNSIVELFSDNQPIENCVYPTAYSGVSILPNSAESASMEVDLYSDVASNYFLLNKKVHDYAKKNFDVTLIDCPPNLGMFFVQALCTADCAIIPIVAGSRFSLDGFEAAFEAVNSVSNKLNHNLKFLKAIVNKVDMRVSISKMSVEYLRTNFSGQIFETTIPQNAEILKAESDRETVIRHSPSSAAAQRFKAWALEVKQLIL